MADPIDQLEAKVQLIIDAQMVGMAAMLNALQSVQSASTKAGVSTAKVSAAFAGVSKSLGPANKFLAQYNKSATKTAKIQRQLHATFKGFGNAIRSSFGLAGGVLASFAGMIKHVGGTLFQFEVASMGATSALKSLEDAYTGVSRTAGTAAVSMQDVAKELTAFQSQGVAQS